MNLLHHQVIEEPVWVRKKAYFVIVSDPLPWGCTDAIEDAALARYLLRTTRKRARTYRYSEPGGVAFYDDVLRVFLESITCKGGTNIRTEVRRDGFMDATYEMTSTSGVERHCKVIIALGFESCPLPASMWERVLDD